VKPYLFAMLLIVQPAMAVDIEFTKEEHAACEKEGGCLVMTKLHLASLMAKAHAAGCKAML
jgi:hypothetical protein